MKEIIKKTQKEIEGEAVFLPVKVKDTNFYFWACDDCNVAFFGDDQILKSSKGGCKCPNMRQGYFTKHPCLNRITGGDEECFNKYYRLASLNK